MKKPARKLALSTTTIRMLTTGALNAVVGGGFGREGTVILVPDETEKDTVCAPVSGRPECFPSYVTACFA